MSKEFSILDKNAYFHVKKFIFHDKSADDFPVTLMSNGINDTNNKISIYSHDSSTLSDKRMYMFPLTVGRDYPPEIALKTRLSCLCRQRKYKLARSRFVASHDYFRYFRFQIVVSIWRFVCFNRT